MHSIGFNLFMRPNIHELTLTPVNLGITQLKIARQRSGIPRTASAHPRNCTGADRLNPSLEYRHSKPGIEFKPPQNRTRLWIAHTYLTYSKKRKERVIRNTVSYVRALQNRANIDRLTWACKQNRQPNNDSIPSNKAAV